MISGGQSGVDRAALDVAMQLRVPCGGWCPKGRLAEDGTIPDRYPLQETPSALHAQRTEWNVRDSDGTLVLTLGQPTEGTAFTIAVTKRLGKPCLVLDLARTPEISAVQSWATQYGLQTLNVAGPRESKCPGIYQTASALLRKLLEAVRDDQDR
jgi:hypothetical protein